MSHLYKPLIDFYQQVVCLFYRAGYENRISDITVVLHQSTSFDNIQVVTVHDELFLSVAIVHNYDIHTYIAGADPGFDRGGGPDRDRPKTAILGPQFCRILVLGPHFWWSGGARAPGPCPGSTPALSIY